MKIKQIVVYQPVSFKGYNKLSFHVKDLFDIELTGTFFLIKKDDDHVCVNTSNVSQFTMLEPLEQITEDMPKEPIKGPTRGLKAVSKVNVSEETNIQC